jgi:hypothetical protein
MSVVGNVYHEPATEGGEETILEVNGRTIGFGLCGRFFLFVSDDDMRTTPSLDRPRQGTADHPPPRAPSSDADDRIPGAPIGTSQNPNRPNEQDEQPQF